MAKKVFQSMDGNQAAAHNAYAFTEVAGIYPITPSSPMAEYIDLWASQGKKNLFDMPVKVIEMQSEAGAAGTVHGSLQAGALTTTFTASQGLLLKLPNMYKIAGELLPGVIHVAARSIAVQALSIFGDHQDVMAARPTGFAILSSGSVQESMDLASVAHLAAIESSIPFLHFFDGFRTSHEVNKVEVMDYAELDRLIDRDAVKRFRKRALNSQNPVTRGSAQNDDVYMQAREIQDKYYANVPDIVAKYLAEISKITGRDYAPFVYYGAEDATDVIIAMGSVTEAIEETIDYLAAKGQKVGLLTVHLYRPWSTEYFLDKLPKTVKRISVLDRTKESGSVGEPLYLDVKSVFYGKENAPVIVGGRYGLSSKDTTPGQIVAVYKNLAGEQRDGFTIGIVDDVNGNSLPHEEIDVVQEGTTELLFFGFGSDGTVGASKNTIKIIGENTDLYGQAYSSYDSKKSGGVTRMHLRFGKDPIRSTYLVNQPHFVSCSKDSYLEKYDMVSGLRQGGTFLLNTVNPPEEVEALLPNKVKKQLADANATLYIINAVKLAEEAGLGVMINTIMQSAFFALNEQILPYDKAVKLMKKYAKKAYGRKGDAVVEKNYKAIDAGKAGLIEVQVKPEWTNLVAKEEEVDMTRPEFVRNIADKVNAIKGYDLPVSAFTGYEDGTMDNGGTAYEKRGVANYVPEWIEDNCIQCNQCAFACPHGVIRPFLLTEEEMANAPEGMKTKKAVGKALVGLQYKIQISTLDCTGCSVCVEVCPAKTKALAMSPIHEEMEKGEIQNTEYLFNKVSYKDTLMDKKANAKNSQFAKPLFEFSGACAGCGETPYVKLVTQLFGERMQIANATGCSSIYGGSFPATPYTVLDNGRGPAWANSLFEDNAEFGYGMRHANETLRDRLQNVFVNNKDNVSKEEAELFTTWIENRADGDITLDVFNKLMPLVEGSTDAYAEEIKELSHYIVKQSNWIIGGDGWAYDIGYGGLDHVIANKEDINILVVDTEVYSNTGGQSSKSAPTGSIAKFTASGKDGKKKDLAAIAMSYGHVYVAQVSHGASQQQVLKAFKEAEEYNGPSLILAYSPCIAHKLKGGLTNSQNQSKLATVCGYWPTFRFDPRLETTGKNPFQIDCKDPSWDRYKEFLMNEARYAQLYDINPDKADDLLDGNLAEAKRRWSMYKRYAAMDYSVE
ncbi:Pyruvate-flavodoxin oxidoreductase [Candidatus Izimaplasma bacterium HR1]|jgi:pyruvate-ferredoxin/flavodoxin oxidoreductase|uniref:pyruvate:ferredoxin (flavodoxin) oxidoreductase n=1 Tax=Candidatus Izimoplasma sp. HR1 TaxID=1541959 RepID=UPI0004F827E7|nr:Pyruvate-flavodoxin oxidoreductase [Candidatus Izimaplasma bacterium HR1]